MHISDGILPPRVCLAGYAITGFCTWYSLRKIRQQTNPTEQIPKASLLTAAFFVSSLIHLPIPPTSIHLILNGLMGVMLGYYAFPAILIGLLFQAIMFQHGGLTTLGVNAAMMGIPALFAYHIFQWGKPWQKEKSGWQQGFLAFVAGGGALALSSVIFTLIVLTFISEDLNVQAERTMTFLALGGYSIQAVIEGIVTVMVVSFLQRVKPELVYHQLSAVRQKL